MIEFTQHSLFGGITTVRYFIESPDNTDVSMYQEVDDQPTLDNLS